VELPDHRLIQDALKVTKKVTWSINESKRIQDNLKILSSIEDKVDGLTEKLSSRSDRKLLKEGVLLYQKDKHKRKQTGVFLFSDVLLIVIPKQERFEVLHTSFLHDIQCALLDDNLGSYFLYLVPMLVRDPTDFRRGYTQLVC
jgi:hypothetical protein